MECGIRNDKAEGIKRKFVKQRTPGEKIFLLPGVLISALETYLYRFETINGRAFVSGAFQRAHLDTLMQVPAGRGC